MENLILVVIEYAYGVETHKMYRTQREAYAAWDAAQGDPQVCYQSIDWAVPERAPFQWWN